MKIKSLKLIIGLISFSVIGLIAIQFYWINLALKLEEEKFNKNVGNALSDLVKNIEDKETAKILIKEISPSDSNGLMFFNKDKRKHYSFKSNFSSSNNQVMLIGDDTNNINIEVNTISDSNIGNVQVLQKFRTQNDSTIQETIIWKSNLDTLIHKKSKIIENVFDELVLTEKNINILSRISEDKIDSLLNDELTKYGITSNYGFAVINDDSIVFKNNIQDSSKILLSNYKVKLFPNDFIKSQNFLLVDFKNRDTFLLKSIWWVLLSSIILTGLIIGLFYQTIRMLIKQKKITEIKNDLLSNITHEFKTPISTISLAADVIGEESSVDKIKYSGIIKNESQRLTNMVENILSVAELESGEFKLNKVKTNVHELINETASKFDLTMSKLNGKFSFNLAARTPNLNIDKTQFTIVISNLIDNSIKYNSNEPQIKISTMDNNSAFEIMIEDNGIGIDKKNQEKIFDTFYRVSTGNVHDVKGNGIGLSLVKKIVESHLGKIEIQSEKNVGSKFIINLPKIN
ncbi:MAG: HAMP domain-containing histidine kinase [Ignavibacteriae bacterium]|nr:HAMP domain-containing histidine kinase [Ignavibacteriota bacterium]MCB9209545.1 HAMP domain-containing histidine kinase [Ignavibacteriales bacterium]MCB9258188.1 HAMP domain-containing histidine kinase [Ignavibacteriales bacterium]